MSTFQKTSSPTNKSQPTVEEDWNSILLTQLECPICFETCIPPIYMCVKGHNLCSNCRKKLRECGLCRAKISDGQNWFAQEISTHLVKLPCKNAPRGCKETATSSNMAKHLEVCSFQVMYPCYVNSYVFSHGVQFCSWKGPVEAIFNHVNKEHPFYLSVGESTELTCSVNPKLTGLLPNITLISAHGKLFWFEVFWSGEELAIAGVHFIGDEIEAANFRYEIAVLSGDGRSHLKFGNVVDVKKPWPNRPVCLQLTPMLMESFGENGVVKFKVTFSRNSKKKNSR